MARTAHQKVDKSFKYLGVVHWVPGLVDDDHVAGSHQVDAQRACKRADQENLLH